MSFLMSEPSQPNPTIHVGDEGVQFISTLYDENGDVVNLTGATSLKYRFKSPENITTEKTASIYGDPLNGKMVYTIDDLDFIIAGEWKYQAVIQLAGGTYHTNVRNLTIYPNI